MVEMVWSSGGFESGGNYAFICPAIQIARIRALDENNRTYDHKDKSAGAQINVFISDLVGDIKIIPNKNMSSAEMLVTLTDFRSFL